MKRLKNKYFIAFMCLFIGLICFISISNTEVDAATSGGYALKPAESTDNVDISNGAYLVTGDPGQTIELKLEIVNQESDKRTFLYQANTAYTSNNGGLGYDKEKVTDPSLKFKVHNLVTPNRGTITIPGKATATVTATLTIPKGQFAGSIMGGFNVAPYKEKAKGTVSQNGTLIKNKFSYSIPIQVKQTNNETVDAKYTVRTVKPATVDDKSGPKKPGVKANVHNSTNSYMGSLTSKAVVTKKGDDKFKIKTTRSDQNIAPTSNYDYSISWGDRSLQSGEYHLKLTYTAPGGLKSWVINKDFTITNSDAAKYNKLAGIKPNYLWLYILLGVLALAIILGLGVYLGRRNNNNNGGSNKPTRRRRR